MGRLQRRGQEPRQGKEGLEWWVPQIPLFFLWLGGCGETVVMSWSFSSECSRLLLKVDGKKSLRC